MAPAASSANSIQDPARNDGYMRYTVAQKNSGDRYTQEHKDLGKMLHHVTCSASGLQIGDVNNDKLLTPERGFG